jgi:glycogen debranching enzyme
MPRKAAAARKVSKRSEVSRTSEQARKSGLLTRGAPSVTHSIADALCIKNGNIFVVTEPGGNVPLGDGHGYGLYYHDCRYLNGYEFQLADTSPLVLAATTGAPGSASFELTNPHLELEDGQQLPSGDIVISWQRELEPAGIQVLDRIQIKNYSQSKVSVPVALSFDAGFEDVFAVRGIFSERTGKLHAPTWRDGHLIFAYDGADHYARQLTIGFSPRPDVQRTRSARYRIALDRLESREIQVTLAISEVAGKKRARPSKTRVVQPALADPKIGPAEGSKDWSKDWPEIQSDSLLLNQVIDRAIRDLQSLRSTIRGEGYFAAGIPWFATLFGRDSLITAMQMLPIKPQIAAETLRLLATYQAQAVDPWRDAQPGKILHELRVGELATIGSIPHSPYYGTVDATPLFLILMHDYVAWTGDLSLFDELRAPMELALRWIDEYGDSDGDGYVDYHTASKQGLVNQGWKDSSHAILNSDGSYANPPIALVEVQGYVYRAKVGLASLYARRGEVERASALQKSAESLRARFNRDFWSDELGIYVLALQAGGKPASVVASNAGHSLWSGIADAERARMTVQRLMEKDMFSGWGIRTLSENEKAFNPIGYHVGSIWPHDNAMIVDGFMGYGFHDQALQVFMGIFDTAINFAEFQLPELFAGFSKERYSVPVRYPAACHPQAWAAGSIPSLLCSLLGLRPNAFEHKLEIRQPMLPDSVNSLDITGLRIGDSTVNVHYGRASDGRAVVQALQSDARLQVKID